MTQTLALGLALTEFSQPEDVDPSRNRPINFLAEGGSARYCFRRGCFEPSPELGNEISHALRAWELGDRYPMMQLAERLRREHGIEMLFNSITIIPPTIAMITHVILVVRREVDLWSTCGLA